MITPRPIITAPMANLIHLPIPRPDDQVCLSLQDGGIVSVDDPGLLRYGYIFFADDLRQLI